MVGEAARRSHQRGREPGADRDGPAHRGRRLRHRLRERLPRRAQHLQLRLPRRHGRSPQGGVARRGGRPVGRPLRVDQDRLGIGPRRPGHRLLQVVRERPAQLLDRARRAVHPAPGRPRPVLRGRPLGAGVPRVGRHRCRRARGGELEELLRRRRQREGRRRPRAAGVRRLRRRRGQPAAPPRPRPSRRRRRRPGARRRRHHPSDRRLRRLDHRARHGDRPALHRRAQPVQPPRRAGRRPAGVPELRARPDRPRPRRGVGQLDRG
jgi:hypothetical protein